MLPRCQGTVPLLSSPFSTHPPVYVQACAIPFLWIWPPCRRTTECAGVVSLMVRPLHAFRSAFPGYSAETMSGLAACMPQPDRSLFCLALGWRPLSLYATVEMCIQVPRRPERSCLFPPPCTARSPRSPGRGDNSGCCRPVPIPVTTPGT